MARDPALTALVVGLVVGARSAAARSQSARRLHDRVSQEPVPLAMRGDHESNEIVGSPPSATNGVHDALTLHGAQPERGFAGVPEVAVRVLASEQERLRTTAVARSTSEHDHSLLAAVLVLDPRRAAAPAEVWSDQTLEDPALEAVRPRHRGELGRLIDEVRRNDPAAAVEVGLVRIASGEHRTAGRRWKVRRHAGRRRSRGGFAAGRRREHWPSACARAPRRSPGGRRRSDRRSLRRAAPPVARAAGRPPRRAPEARNSGRGRCASGASCRGGCPRSPSHLTSAAQPEPCGTPPPPRARPPWTSPPRSTATRAPRSSSTLDGDPRTAVLVDPELDMVCCLPAGASASAAADPAFATLAADGWHVAKLRVRPDWLREHQPNVEADQPTTTVLRCCLRRREHAAVGDLAAALGEHLAAAATRVSEASAAARPAR